MRPSIFGSPNGPAPGFLLFDSAEKEGLGFRERKSPTKWEVPHLRLSKHLSERHKIVKGNPEGAIEE